VTAVWVFWVSIFNIFFFSTCCSSSLSCVALP